MTNARATAITRRNAIEMTLAYLRRDEDFGVRLGRLGMTELISETIHLAQAIATVMEEENGGREGAIKSLQRQLYEANAQLAGTDAS